MIWAAAVQYPLKDGTTVTIPCFRHGEGMKICQILNKELADNCRPKEGFLTTSEEFLDRKSALTHAIDCGQLNKTTRWYKRDHKDTELYSEDLW